MAAGPFKGGIMSSNNKTVASQGPQTKTNILSIHRRQSPDHIFPLVFTVGSRAIPPNTPGVDAQLFPIVEKITSVSKSGKYAHSLQPSFIIHFENSDTKRAIPVSEVIDVAYQQVNAATEPAMPTIVEINDAPTTESE